jgi:hypothetical protein
MRSPPFTDLKCEMVNTPERLSNRKEHPVYTRIKVIRCYAGRALAHANKIWMLYGFEALRIWNVGEIITMVQIGTVFVQPVIKHHSQRQSSQKRAGFRF